VLWQALVSLLLVAAIAAWVARLLRTRLAKPIQEIDATMQAVSEGNYEARVTTRSRDELGRLAIAINETIDKVRRNVADIERSRDAAMQALNDAGNVPLTVEG
jgi:methyl-accepting chemotaxis protein